MSTMSAPRVRNLFIPSSPCGWAHCHLFYVNSLPNVGESILSSNSLSFRLTRTLETMERTRASRTESSLVAELASASNVSLRAVQLWRKKNDPRWTEFLRRRAQENQITFASITPTGDRLTPDEELATAERRFAALSRNCDQEQANGNWSGATHQIKLSIEQQKLLQILRENHKKIGEMEGRYLDVEKVRDWIFPHLTMMKNRLEILPEAVASRISGDGVAEIVRSEVDSILRELASAGECAPWFSKNISQE